MKILFFSCFSLGVFDCEILDNKEACGGYKQKWNGIMAS